MLLDEPRRRKRETYALVRYPPTRVLQQPRNNPALNADCCTYLMSLVSSDFVHLPLVGTLEPACLLRRFVRVLSI